MDEREEEKVYIEPDSTDIPSWPRDALEDLLASSSSYTGDRTPVKIDEELRERERLRNEDLEQDIKLKRLTLKALLGFLGGETAVIFGFAFLQGTKIFGFSLEEWSFRMIVGATIIQIYLMLRIAVDYLFPKSTQ